MHRIPGPIRVVLTGGIACGKTVVSDDFRALGTEVVDTDIISRELSKPGSPMLEAIAKALGAGALSADGSLNRRAVRVSMGSVFLVPWTWLPGDISLLSSYGFKTVAMALTDHSVPLDHPALMAEERLASVMGTEGDGLPAHAIAKADFVVRIPMAHGVDSLNVAAASAVAFWQLRVR